MVLISHTKPSPAYHFLLPRAPCRGPLDPAALAPGLAHRGSSAKCRRRAPDSSPLSINSSASVTATSRDWIPASSIPRGWTRPFTASSFPLNVSADFASVSHLPAGSPQHPPSSWSSIDVEEKGPAHQHRHRERSGRQWQRSPTVTDLGSRTPSQILASRSESALKATSFSWSAWSEDPQRIARGDANHHGMTPFFVTSLPRQEIVLQAHQSRIACYHCHHCRG